jgi:glycosyltransferase involved in cell wall biosynthesis
VKLAFVTPRYGADILTGPEHVCRLLAEHISKRHDVDVITTCARDARGSRNDYPEGPDRVRGVRIRRFPVSAHRAPTAATSIDRLVGEPHGREDELDWVRQSSPWSTALVEHLKHQHHTYDAVVFFSMSAATTVFGLPVTPDRSILVPYVQLDPSLRFSLWTQVLSTPRAIGLVSATERRLIRDYVRAGTVHDELVGIGIERPPQASYPRHQQDPGDTLVGDDDPPAADEDAVVPVLEGPGIPFRRRHRLYGSFALFGGRMEPGNGCQEMLDYFDTFATSMDAPPSLVLMGMKLMRVPDAPYLRHAGVLPDRERMLAFEAADLTIAPASEDLVAESVLESFAVGTPVVASARNGAAVEHCSKANAGLYYENRAEFVECLQMLATDADLRRKLGESGRQYIDQHYRWDAVIARLEHLLGRIRGRSAA